MSRGAPTRKVAIMPAKPAAVEKAVDELVTIRRSDLERILALLQKLEG